VANVARNLCSQKSLGTKPFPERSKRDCRNQMG
jgi:hypothetical protein